MPAEKCDPRLKTLAINEVDLWDKSANIDDYMLYVETKEESQNIDESQKVSFFDQDQIVSYVAGGEVIPARAVARKFRRTEDYTFPFHNVKELFVESDISSIILENSISGEPEPCYGCTWFVGDEAFIEGLEYLGVDLVSPGNHMGDGGIDAIKRTIEVLKGANVSYTGFSENDMAEASEPSIIDVNGFKVAFLGYDDIAYYHWAGGSSGGTASVSSRNSNGSKEILDEKIVDDIEKANSNSDYVVVLMSWGDREYVNWALENQEEMGHKFIDSGANLIIGSHQHWVSEIEFYNDGMIFYGIGNFVFDQTHTDPTRQGVLLKFTFFNKNLVNVKIIPHQSCGPQQNTVDSDECNHFQPQILDEDDPVYKIILDRMFEFSDI